MKCSYRAGQRQQGGTGEAWLSWTSWSGESWVATLRTGQVWVVGEQEGASQALEGPFGMSAPRACVLCVLYLAGFLVLGTEQVLNQ